MDKVYDPRQGMWEHHHHQKEESQRAQFLAFGVVVCHLGKTPRRNGSEIVSLRAEGGRNFCPLSILFG